MATLTYVYADSTAVLGPLATYAEPHTYDLCAVHAERLTVPLGWEAVRLALPEHISDDRPALADAVREAAVEPSPEGAQGHRGGRAPLESPTEAQTPRRGHLRILRDP